MSPCAKTRLREVISQGDPLHVDALKPPEEPPPGLVAGLVSECVTGIDHEALVGHRAELDRIQQSTGAQFVSKEDLSGGYTVIVSGTRQAVERALPCVRRALQGSRKSSASSTRPAPRDEEGSVVDTQKVEVKAAPWRRSSSRKASNASSAVEEPFVVEPGSITVAVVEADTPHDDNPIPMGPSSFLTSVICAATGSPPPPGLAEPEIEAEADAAGKKRKKTKAEKRMLPQEDAAGLDEACLADDGIEVAKVTNFTFPKPCAMEGVKSRKKVIFRMNNVSFSYGDGRSSTIVDANIEMSQASRIVVTGAKSSGKSTLVKVLLGKLKLSEGAIQKAVGLSVAYVAQHMFHQLEEHMHLTPLQYMMWRFADGYDKENPEFQHPPQVRDCTQDAMEQHLADFGVDEQSANRLHVKQFNRSMRFRLVLAAAMWLNPNLLILDEPASCLDRTTLEALAPAIEDFKGGILITSHTKDRHYFEAVASEKYALRGGRLRPDGSSVEHGDWPGEAHETEARQADAGAGPPPPRGGGPKASRPQAPAAASVSQPARTGQKLSAKDAKERFKDVERRLKDGTKSKTLTDEDMWKMLNELNQLKELLES